MQRAALAALRGGRALPRDGARRAIARPAIARAPGCTRRPALPPGGAYLWVDFSRWTGDDCMPVLEKVAEAGVLLAPGSAFGDACGGFARLCFTGVDEARLDEGIDRINRVLAALGVISRARSARQLFREAVAACDPARARRARARSRSRAAATARARDRQGRARDGARRRAGRARARRDARRSTGEPLPAGWRVMRRRHIRSPDERSLAAGEAVIDS